ncbi:MAG: PfkB family carbohydrate kinase [Bacteroidetes bacterium]|nr:PfkB family carbohydrate kinase [Bacteroidota bacterium]
MKKITSFGEILFDVYPEFKKLGGAPFNFIYHIKKLTGNGNLISRIGNDDAGNEILSLMKLNFISTQFMQVDAEHPTGAASANLDENKIPHWKIETDCAYDFMKPDENIRRLINKSTDCLYFGTLAQRSEQSKMTLHSLFGRRIKYFCDLNIRQSFYSKKIIETSLKACNVLKLNDEELKLVNNLFFQENFDEINLAKIISERFEIDLVCITAGDRGTVLFKDGKSDDYKIDVENVVDTVGAGDAYASILCLGYLENWDISKINRIASSFAAEIVKIEGALPNDDSLYNEIRTTALGLQS